jgi:large subunit ribosomal protein L54
MKGLNIMKAGTDPVAMPNADYPAWLWTITDKANQGAKKDARKANRMAIKRKNFFAGRL